MAQRSARLNEAAHERWLTSTTGSPLERAQQRYWTTKQSLMRRLGRKEDECVVSSDSQLDAKLELYGSVSETCCSLHRILGFYQEQLCVLAHEENALGCFLRQHGKEDKTRAGKMMVVVGKTMSYTAQQRLSLRTPLSRLNQEVETFHERAVRDTGVTVRRMEKARTEYRGALLWMKDISQQLDPDTGRHLERFRKVQSQVKSNKRQFDQLKLDCLQKVDLLAASRCNMFSHSLVLYQNSLLQFWQRTARAMKQVADSFTGYQYYEFSVVRELCEPSRQLANKTGGGGGVVDSDADEENVQQRTDSVTNTSSRTPLGSLLDNEDLPDNELTEGELVITADNDNSIGGAAVGGISLIGGSEGGQVLHDTTNSNKHDDDDRLLDFSAPRGRVDSSVTQLVDDGGALYNQPATTSLLNQPSNSNNMSQAGNYDLLGCDRVISLSSSDRINDDSDDERAMLEQLLASPTRTSSRDILTSNTLQDIFGGLSVSDDGVGAASTVAPPGGGTLLSPGCMSVQSSGFLPSQLLASGVGSCGVKKNSHALNTGSLASGISGNSTATSTASRSGASGKQDADKTDMCDWFGLFAELDPLSNPDAVGSSSTSSLAAAAGDKNRNC